MLVSDEEIEPRKREEGIPDYPESQTPCRRSTAPQWINSTAAGCSRAP